MSKRSRSQGSHTIKEDRDETLPNKKLVKIKNEDENDIYPIKKEEQEETGICTLSPEQEAVLNLVVDDRKSLFFTGAAGTGKSFLLRG